MRLACAGSVNLRKKCDCPVPRRRPVVRLHVLVHVDQQRLDPFASPDIDQGYSCQFSKRTRTQTSCSSLPPHPLLSEAAENLQRLLDERRRQRHLAMLVTLADHAQEPTALHLPPGTLMDSLAGSVRIGASQEEEQRVSLAGKQFLSEGDHEVRIVAGPPADPAGRQYVEMNGPPIQAADNSALAKVSEPFKSHDPRTGAMGSRASRVPRNRTACV